MKTLFTILLSCLIISLKAQPFEGKITYRCEYTSNMQNVTSEQFGAMMGATQEYYIKGGSYKSVTNGTLLQWQLYLNNENKLYNKMSNSETIFWNDGGINNDSILKSELHPKVAEILGYTCDELVLTCVSGVQKYYFNTRLGVDLSFYTKHLYGNWFEYLKQSKSLPLKSVIETAQFTLVSTATEVKPMKLSENDFKLPQDAKTAKSPY